MPGQAFPTRDHGSPSSYSPLLLNASMLKKRCSGRGLPSEGGRASKRMEEPGMTSARCLFLFLRAIGAAPFGISWSSMLSMATKRLLSSCTDTNAYSAGNERCADEHSEFEIGQKLLLCRSKLTHFYSEHYKLEGKVCTDLTGPTHLRLSHR